VIPVNETIETRNTVLSFEDCAKMVEASPQVAVVKCPCRLSQKNCSSPLEACIQLNRGAEYALDRGHGRKISKEEALDILRRSEEAGLVHMTENRVSSNVICNCCTCCCEMFRLMKYSGKKWILSPSRYVASVNEECTACGSCVDICPVEAVTVDGSAVVNAGSCMGCGLCATVCSVDAIKLNQARPEEHVPVK
jgi:ferredoxin